MYKGQCDIVWSETASEVASSLVPSYGPRRAFIFEGDVDSHHAGLWVVSDGGEGVHNWEEADGWAPSQFPLLGRMTVVLLEHGGVLYTWVIGV